MDKRLFHNKAIVNALARHNEEERKKARLKTYQLDPKRFFRPESVQRILETVLTKGLEEVNYDSEDIPELCLKLCAEIRAKVKALNFDRYKLVCVVDIVQKNLQSILTVAKYLWDPERDNYAFHTYETHDMIAAAYVFGVYFD